jgi:hypothetical protein
LSLQKRYDDLLEIHLGGNKMVIPSSIAGKLYVKSA